MWREMWEGDMWSRGRKCMWRDEVKTKEEMCWGDDVKREI